MQDYVFCYGSLFLLCAAISISLELLLFVFCVGLLPRHPTLPFPCLGVAISWLCPHKQTPAFLPKRVALGTVGKTLIENQMTLSNHSWLSQRFKDRRNIV